MLAIATVLNFGDRVQVDNDGPVNANEFMFRQ
jgi:hypothetical protein